MLPIGTEFPISFIYNGGIYLIWFCFERRGSMSQLQGILTRLKNLQEQSSSGEPAQRFFEVNGERKCQVTYHPKTETYELEVYNDKEKPKRYQFDNMDMITIEIFDLIQ
jgi:uncharacterized protein YkuJ